MTLLARLRDNSDHYVKGWAQEAMREAADEIERLRRALRAVRPMVDLQGMNIIDEALDPEYRAILQARGLDVYEGLIEQSEKAENK